MTTDKLRAKFEAWWLRNGDPFDLHKVAAWETWQAAHASRDAEIEAMRKDAERYRWLRDRVTGSDGKPFICIFHGSFGLWSDEYADQAIDDAMQAE